MPLPISRGHMLVNLVRPHQNIQASSSPLPSADLDVPSADLDVPSADTSFANISISEHDVFEHSEFIECSVVAENSTPSQCSIIEIIVQPESIQSTIVENATLDDACNIELIDHVETIPFQSNDDLLNPTKTLEPLFTDLESSANHEAHLEEPQAHCFVRSSDLEEQVGVENLQTGSGARESLRINLEDPDYIPENNDSEENEANDTEPNKGRPKRGRKRKYPDQNRLIRKKRSNTNKDYVSAKGKKVSSRDFQGNLFNCNCPLKCIEKLTVDQREKVFMTFWSAGSFEARCAILQGSVKEAQKKRSYSATSKRHYTRTYFLAKIKVCKKTFLNTLNISQSRIDAALEKQRSQTTLNDKRGQSSGGKNAISPQQLGEIKKFIESLPKYTSHYCRHETTANFLAPNLNLSIIYDLYKEKHENHVSFSRFRLCFYNDFNLRFKKPQKDTCFRCDRLKASKTGANSEQVEIIEKEHKEHLDHAYSLRDQMKEDLARAKTDPTLETLTFDLEKTHCLPRLPTSIVYYKRQLNLHNLGIHCGSNGQGYFNIWLEHEAGRGTQEVGSCLNKFIKEHLKPTATELILWSDSCGGQNRSIKMMLMLLHILHKHEMLQKITLRFLHPGHTYLPNDSEFGDVECALKNQMRLYTAEDYITVMRNCRKKKKFNIARLQKEDFRSVAPMLERITNRKMDIEKQKISWMTTFEIEVRKSDPAKLFMKNKLEENPKEVDISKGAKGRRSHPNFVINLPVLYPDGRALSEAKIKDLKEMLKLIPADAKPFYSFLRNVATGDFIDDTEGFGNTIDFELNDDEEG